MLTYQLHSLLFLITLVILLLLSDILLVIGLQKNTCIGSDAYNDMMEQRVKEERELTKSERKTRWAIVALTRPKSDVRTRNMALVEKLKPYAHKHNITVIFFSELEIPSSMFQGWQKAFEGIATVRIINTASRGFNLPERFGYKYMCKFFSIDMYDYLRGDYDYYMRCDTDCYLKSLSYDIFQWAVDNRVGYGFSMRKLEAHGPTKQTLPLWTSKYMQRCNLEPTAVMDKPLSVCFNFYNNWHIGKVSFFNRPDVRHFLEAVNASGHIQTHRWGDSTVQAYAVRLFMDPINIVQVPNFSYTHGSHNAFVTTFGDGGGTTVPQRLPNWVSTKQT